MVNKNNDKKLNNLINAAAEIVSDFDIYGEILQADKNGKYSKKTPIEQLRKALMSFNE